MDKFNSLEVNLIVTGCRNDCLHCAESQNKKSQLVMKNLNDLEDSINKFGELKEKQKVNFIQFNILEEFFSLINPKKIVKLVTKYNKENFITIATSDGSLVRQSKADQLLNSLKDFGLKNVQITFQGYNRNHDSRVKQKNNYLQLLETAKIVKDSGLNLNWNYFFYKDNIAEFNLVQKDLNKIDTGYGDIGNPLIANYAGNCIKVENKRLDKSDLNLLPESLCQKLLKRNRTEDEWANELKESSEIIFPNKSDRSFWIYSNLNVYDGPCATDNKVCSLNDPDFFSKLIMGSEGRKKRIESINDPDFVLKNADFNSIKLHSRSSVIQRWHARYCMNNGLSNIYR